MASKPTAPAPSAPVTEPTPTPAPIPTPKPDVSDALAQDSAVAKLLSTKPSKKEKPVEKPAAPALAPAPEPAHEPAPAQPEPATPTAPAPQKPAMKVRKSQPAPAFDPQALATAVADGITKALPKPAEPAAEVVTLPEHLAPMKPLYDQLESMNPKYKGITKKMSEFAQKEFDYAGRWEDQERARLIQEGKAAEANEVAFNPNDPQHAHFYDRYAPKIDPNDLDEAKFEVRFNDRFNKMVKPKLEEADKTIVGLKAQPEAQASVGQFGDTLIRALNPESEPSREAFQKWSESNPLESEVAEQLQGQVAPAVHAASLLWDGAIQIDPNDQAHTAAAAAFNRLEQSLAAQPTAVEDEKGRTWLPLTEYNNLPKSKRAEHFTTTKQALVKYIALSTAQQVKAIAENQRAIIEKNAQRLGYQKSQVAPVAPATTPAAPTKPNAPLVSPSVSGSGPIPATTGVAPAPKVEMASTVGSLLGVR